MADLTTKVGTYSLDFSILTTIVAAYDTPGKAAAADGLLQPAHPVGVAIAAGDVDRAAVVARHVGVHDQVDVRSGRVAGRGDDAVVGVLIQPDAQLDRAKAAFHRPRAVGRRLRAGGLRLGAA